MNENPNRSVKSEYLRRLRENLESQLNGVSKDEIEDILRDTQAHFEEALRNGKSEINAADSLGDPKDLAAGYLAQALIRPQSSQLALSERSLILFRVMKAIFILAPMNFIWAFGPFTLLVGLIAAGWLVSITIAGLPLVIAMSGATVSSELITNAEMFNGFLVFSGLTCISFGVLTLLIMAKVTELGARALWSWIRWNINFLMAN